MKLVIYPVQCRVTTHDILTSGHQGTAKMLQQFQQVVKWVEMAQAVVQHSTQCVVR